MVDHFGPEDNRWRYPQLDTEYEPNEGRCPYRALVQAVQGHTTAKGQQMTRRMVKQRTFRESWALSFGLCSVTQKYRSFGRVAVLGRGIY